MKIPTIISLLVLNAGLVNAQNSMVRISGPPPDAVGTIENYATDTLTRIVAPPAMATGALESEQPDTDVTWTTVGNVHIFGFGTVYECIGEATPASGVCSGVRAPPDLPPCGLWTYSFRSVWCCVPCGGPFGTMVLTYWLSPGVGYDNAAYFGGIYDSSPRGDCTFGYRSQGTFNSAVPGCRPRPTPTPTPTP